MSTLLARSTRRGMLAGTAGLLFAAGSGLRAGPPDRVEFLLAWGERGDGPGQFHSPIHVAVNAADEVYVADLNNARIQKFTADGTYLSQFPLPLDAPPRKSCIVGGLAVDEGGLIYVSFMNQHRIAVYDDAGAVVREWGCRGGGEGEFNQPGGMVLRRDGTLFAVDQCNHRVQHFTRDGRFLGAWGGHGSEPGRFGGSDPAGSRFAGPHFLGQDREGRLYTTEAGLGRVQQLAPDGRPLRSWGDKGDQPGGFGALNFGSLAGTYGPIGLTLDRRDRVWVSSLNDRVQCFTPEGRFLFGIVESGPEPGQLDHPHGMAFDGRGRLYVADSSNQRIQKFAIPAP
ncbi:hypothetical protein [Paludisphaera soli]|uniref:hypothetical protein n=1 Tax=Paludisphaera soli TaxID=2712865 RepID=UPI0013EA28AA|nr:hypothetical protein [Paludisphaera soli]